MIDKLTNWQKLHTFSLAEAALLVTENYPDDWPEEKLLLTPAPKFLPIYRLMLQDAVIIKNHEEISEETGEAFTSYVLHTDKPFQATKLSLEDGFNIQVQKHALKEWLSFRGISSRFFKNKSLASFETTKVEEDKPLSSREKNSLYRIIAALVEANLNHPKFTNQSNLITHLVDHYAGYPGLSKSNLEKLFPEAAKTLR